MLIRWRCCSRTGPRLTQPIEADGQRCIGRHGPGTVGLRPLLLAKGAKAAGSALHVAAMNGYLGMASLLMDHGADWELKDRYGVSPIEHAVAAGHMRLARLMGVSGDGGMNVARRTEILGRQERACTL